MPFITNDFAVRPRTDQLWVLLEPVEYAGSVDTWMVPAGFVTDFASVPRLASWLIPTYGVYTRAAILHDYFCEGNGNVTRRDADGLFRRVLRELGVSLPRRWMMWAGVRAASGMSDASMKEWLQFLLVGPLALIFIAIPAVIVQTWLIVFYCIEWLFALGRKDDASKVWTT